MGRSQTRECVLPVTPWSLSAVWPGVPADVKVKPDIPENDSTTPVNPQKPERRRSHGTGGEARHPGTPPSGRRTRGEEGIALAVKAACRPRRSKRVPLPQGLSQSIHGSSSAPWMPRANSCPQGGVPASPHPPPLDEYGKPLRWHGCGCWDVLRWSNPHISHRRRGPRSGQSNCFRRRLRRPRRPREMVSESMGALVPHSSQTISRGVSGSSQAFARVASRPVPQ